MLFVIKQRKDGGFDSDDYNKTVYLYSAWTSRDGGRSWEGPNQWTPVEAGESRYSRPRQSPRVDVTQGSRILVSDDLKVVSVVLRETWVEGAWDPETGNFVGENFQTLKVLTSTDLGETWSTSMPPAPQGRKWSTMASELSNDGRTFGLVAYDNVVTDGDFGDWLTFDTVLLIRSNPAGAWNEVAVTNPSGRPVKSEGYVAVENNGSYLAVGRLGSTDYGASWFWAERAPVYDDSGDRYDGFGYCQSGRRQIQVARPSNKWSPNTAAISSDYGQTWSAQVDASFPRTTTPDLHVFNDCSAFVPVDSQNGGRDLTTVWWLTELSTLEWTASSPAPFQGIVTGSQSGALLITEATRLPSDRVTTMYVSSSVDRGKKWTSPVPLSGPLDRVGEHMAQAVSASGNVAAVAWQKNDAWQVTVIELEAPPSDKALTIKAERVRAKAKSFIKVTGTSTGFTTGTPVSLMVKAAGTPSYRQAGTAKTKKNGKFTARLAVATSAYVYARTSDGTMSASVRVP